MRFFSTLLTFLVIFSGNPLTAQSCTSGSFAQINLETNAVRARLHVNGNLWGDGQFGVYEVTADELSPNFNPVTAIYSGALWVGGKDPGGSIRMAAPRYGLTRGRVDYYPGPLTADGQTNPDTCARWDLFFVIEREDIRRFLSGFDPDNPDVDLIPRNIARWPGIGNPLFQSATGFDLPERELPLAPFVDVDEDGFYNPLRGDYPAFCGETAVWCVFNDNGPHRDSNIPNVLNAEVHLMAYAYRTVDSDPLQRTTFYDYTIINRGLETLSELYAGHWADSDLGCAENDRINSLPDRNLFYIYNSQQTESSFCVGGLSGYGNTSPVNIFQILRSRGPAGEKTDGLLNSVVPVFGSAGSGIPLQLTTPRSPAEYYNFLSGRAKDGEPLTRGGFGYRIGGDTTRYIFDGGPTETGAPWTHCAEQLPARDLRHVYGTGPYTLDPGERAEFTLAITTKFRVLYTDLCPEEATIIATADEVADFYEEDCAALRATPTRSVSVAKTDLRVFPNPVGNRVTFALPAGGSTIGTLSVMDGTGRLLTSINCEQTSCTLEMNDGNLPGGVYFYQVTTHDGRVVAGRFVYAPR